MSAKGTYHLPPDIHAVTDSETRRTVVFPDAIQPGPNEPLLNLRWYWRPESNWRARIVEPGRVRVFIDDVQVMSPDQWDRIRDWSRAQRMGDR